MATIDEIVIKWDEKRPDKTEVNSETGVNWRDTKNGKRGKNIHIGGFKDASAEEFVYIKLLEKKDFKQYGANYIFIYPKTKGGTIKVRFEVSRDYEYKAGKNLSNTYDFLLDIFKDSFNLKEGRPGNKSINIWYLWKSEDILRLGIQLDTNLSADQICERMDYLINKTREKLITWL